MTNQGDFYTTPKKRKLIMPEEEVQKTWLSLFKEKKLTESVFRSYWKYAVPKIFAPSPPCNFLRLSYDEDQIQKELFEPLEWFMCDSEPRDVYDRIQKLDQPPALCVKVFKTGDPTYGCRDCGMDPTCVLCADCFKSSSHNKHRYKISTSAGGGYCDCGDKEAWKNDVFCDKHIKGDVAQAQDHNLLPLVCPDLVERVEFVFGTLLAYATQLLTLQATHLPSDLEIKENEVAGLLNENLDTYVTMLYNDETHTYDQVITALEKAIGCSNREAVAYATIIDREGRCMVRCADFRMCSMAKEVMDRPYGRSASKPLKVQVLHTGIIAHQLFAAKLLSWLHKILEIGQAFRQMFTAIICRDNFHLIESIFSADTQMWKSAGIQWHRLFISGMLMDLESKKLFARVFTKHYSKMMKDFILDDHEHSVCIVSLAVQLFTMPTIAHMLIAEEEVLPRLLTTFLSECEKNTKNGKLSLDPRIRNLNNFKRIQYILYDLKYLLGFKPEVWTSQLRKGFLAGFDKLLQLFSLMQGMDPAVRQVGQHLEFEPEWESAFNLHFKIANILPLIIDWATSDRDVIIKAFRMLLRKLGKETTVDMRRRFVREVLDYSVSCIEYDVSMSPVSLHLPLTRLLAGVLIQLHNYGLYYNSSEFDVDCKPNPEELMEPIFRISVLVSQVNAGMWRRNGFSLTSQVCFYHNVRCRQEMYDRDILLLQQIACMVDANEYLIHLLNRYGLIGWTKGDYDARVLHTTSEDAQRQTVILAEEFLLNIMALVCERYIVGIGEVSVDECLKKEIIQLLCIDPMPHSVLNGALPENVNHETGIEKVIGEVAMFRKHPEAKGFFELKNEYKHWYNQFFYHYNKEEQSKSEVTQRSKCRNEGRPPCCPPPVPPPFKEAFTTLVNFLQCDVLLHIIKVVINRVQASSRSVSEIMFQLILHFICYGLYEEERFLREKDPYFSFTTRAKKFGIHRRLHNLADTPIGSAHKELLHFVCTKYTEVLALTCDVGQARAKGPVHPPACASSTSNAEKKRKADIAAMRKDRIMAKMANMQQQFIKNNTTPFKETCDSETSTAEVVPDTEMEIGDMPLEERIVIGANQTALPSPEYQYTCILCHQAELITATALDGDTSICVMVLGTHVQRSTVLSRDRKNVKHIEDPDSYDCLVLSPDLCLGVHTTSCGHAMHAHCWQRYFDDVCLKEGRKPHRGQNLSFDIEKNEYLCPLCESLCNTALPLLPSLQKKLTASACDINIDDWLAGLQTALQTKVVVEPPPPVAEPVRPTNIEKQIAGPSGISHPSRSYGRRSMWRTSSPSQRKKVEKPTYVQFTFEPIDHVLEKMKASWQVSRFADTFKSMYITDPDNLPQFSNPSKDMMSGFALAVYALGLGVPRNELNGRIVHMVMASTAYTIHTTEQVQRNAGNALLASVPKRLLDSLSALVKFSAYIPFRLKEINELSVPRLLSTVFEHSDPSALCILDWDSFSLLVSFAFCMPAQFPEAYNMACGSIQEHFVLRICFYSSIIQILLTIDETRVYSDFDEEDEPEMATEVPDEEFLMHLLIIVRTMLDLPIINVNGQKLVSYVKEQGLPFLRCAGLLFHFLTDIKVPEELQAGVWVPESEYICLLRYLGLGLHFRDIFADSCFTSLLELWLSHGRLREVRENMSSRSWTHINQLVPLPSDYSELINTASQFPCPATIGDDSHAPTMCLICGEVLCSQSYCCRMELPETGYVTRVVGACTHHANYCGAGTGIFIRVRECRGLMLSGRLKGCYVAPPYLDEYGETDQGLKRGNPLTLDENLYRRLSAKWLSHSIPNQIARTMENGQSLITEWFYF